MGEVQLNAQVVPIEKLAKEEEALLSKHLIEMAGLGFGFNAFHVTELVKFFPATPKKLREQPTMTSKESREVFLGENP